MPNFTEIRVRPVTRFVITRYDREDIGDDRSVASCTTLGLFENESEANYVAAACAEMVKATTQNEVVYATDASPASPQTEIPHAR